MRGDHLQIKQPASLLLQGLCGKNQGRRGRVPHLAKHGFPGKKPANLYSVKSSGEFVSLPGLVRNGMAAFVQLRISEDEFRPDPTLFPARRRLGTTPDHFPESLIDGETELSCPDRLRQAPGEMEPSER